VYPHRIRLRGPWDVTPVSRFGPDPSLTPPLQMRLPCRWGEAGLRGFAGRALFVRRFGYPGRIDVFERVWLTLAAVTASAEVSLNGQLLGRGTEAEGPFEFAVTELLRPRNELKVVVEAADDRGGLWGEVALEVRCTAFLRQVHCTLEGDRLTVNGTVIGTAERPLDLYALLDGATVAYATVQPAPQGQPFCLASEALTLDSGPHNVRVDLIDGAVVWYTVELAL
jgi:hypothetical protein